MRCAVGSPRRSRAAISSSSRAGWTSPRAASASAKIQTDIGVVGPSLNRCPVVHNRVLGSLSPRQHHPHAEMRLCRLRRFIQRLAIEVRCLIPLLRIPEQRVGNVDVVRRRDPCGCSRAADTSVLLRATTAAKAQRRIGRADFSRQSASPPAAKRISTGTSGNRYRANT